MKEKKLKRPAALKKFIESSRDRLFDISATPLVFRCEEDRLFFEDQKKERKFYIGPLDKDDTHRINDNNERKRRDKRAREQNDYSRPRVSNTADLIREYEMELSCAKRRRLEDGDSRDWSLPPVSHQRRSQLRESTVLVPVDRKNWLDSVAAAADKTMMSGRKALQTAVAGVVGGAGDSSRPVQNQ